MHDVMEADELIPSVCVADELDMPVCRQRVVHNLTLRMDQYIAEPFWPERAQVIDIHKKSGTDRARSEATRAAALTAYLDREGITRDEYDRLVRLAERPWYRASPEDDGSEIIIPEHQIRGCLVEATKRSPAAVIKSGLAENLRTIIVVSDLKTGKHKTDRVFARYIKHPDTNQRRYHESQVIENFTATGTLSFDPSEITAKTVHTLLRWATANIGVGAARKMGYGRGEVVLFSAKTD